MQFKHPEILYGLLLLIIPIIIHLFHFQKFTKVAFTNVKFLKRIELQSRKSSKLKKWLILCTRLFAFASIIFAFAQPYIAQITKNQKQNTIIYIDNSMSMSAKVGSYELLKNVSQKIIENLKEGDNISLLTNDNFFKNLDLKSVKSKILNLDYTSKDLDFETISLTLKQELLKNRNNLHKIILVSDFQENKNIEKIDFSNTSSKITLVKISPTTVSNTAVDSMCISDKSNDQISINVFVKNTIKTTDNVSISLLNDLELVGKGTASFNESLQSEVVFKIPFQQSFNGKIIIDDAQLPFDNTLFFSISKPPKIKVLSIGKSNSFLPKIFTPQEFDLQYQTANQIDYNQLKEQHLVILNELDIISNGLINSLKEFENNGGSLVIIPAIDSDISTYNLFLKTLNGGFMGKLIPTELNITTIHFEHPIFKDVFEKKIQNFEYPNIHQYFELKLNNVTPILSLENELPFFSKIGNSNSTIYVFNSPLDLKFSNFYNSPIVVPLLYNIGINSYKFPKLYYTIGNDNIIAVDVSLKKDQILKLQNEIEEIIPLQQVYKNTVELSTSDIPATSGFYNIMSNNELLKTIAFNYDSNESLLKYSNLTELFKESKNITISNSLEETFTELNKQQEMNSLFRWFLTVAILFLLLEIIILKFFKT
jgi:hypothetical protein